MFAWSKLVPQFTNFYAMYGTFFKFSGCIIPNPFATACLYGSIAFLIALFWSLSVFQYQNQASERWLRNFLLFCVVFAGTIVLLETATYYKLVAPTVSVTCSPGASPVTTPCFTGMLFFIAAFLASIFATRHLSTSDRVGG